MNSENFDVFIPVRTASVRLPKKHLLEINGQPSLKILTERLKKAKKILDHNNIKVTNDLINRFLNNEVNRTLAVLCRTNADCNRISEILNNNNILPTYSNNRLFDQKVIKDIVAFLNLALNSKYNLHSFLRLAKNRFSDNFQNNVIDLWKNNSREIWHS